jgi:phosphatidylglycerophosphate synthase
MTGGRRILALAPLVLGLILLVFTIARTDVQSLARVAGQLGLALPFVLLPSAAWHLLRTIAWYRCFPAGTPVSFARLLRVRLAAEAFSFVTIRGVAGEPLKVVLLQPDVPADQATAAVALERMAYTIVTAVIVGLASIVAIITLALTPLWFRIFRAMAIAAGLMVVVAVVLARRQAPDPAVDATATGAARFFRAFQRQLHGLVRSDRRRLGEILALEALTFVTMVVEVWAVLWVTDVPIGVVGATAIETFTRTASFASAFIPGNIGALEASNVAVAVALNATSGAAALALVRRIRGLFWCAGGFLVYPRAGMRSPRRPDGTHAGPDAHEKSDAMKGTRTAIVIEDAGAEVPLSASLGGLPIGERILRALRRAGYARVLVWAPREHATWNASAKRLASTLGVITVRDEEAWTRELSRLDPAVPITVIPPGIVPSPAALGERSSDLVDTGFSVSTPADLVEAERRLRASIFKPTDGVLGRFNRRMSMPISVGLITWTRLSANAMSLFLIVLGFYAGWLFSLGTYIGGVLGAVVSLASSILDGCDGELARLQYKDSTFGCWLDTFGDYSYYLSIFTGLTIGLVAQTHLPGFWWIGAAVLVGSLITFALMTLLRNRITDGRPERLRSTANAHFQGKSRFGKLLTDVSTVATRATMPYGILVLAVLDLLPIVLVLAAIGAQIYWVSLLVGLRRLLGHRSDLAWQRVPRGIR